MHRFLTALIATCVILLTPAAFAAETGLIVNGVELSASEKQALDLAIGQPTVAGKYWYDAATGFWGYEGGPTMGQLPPGLPQVRGELQANASGGLSEVFLNGRSLHPTKITHLKAVYGQVIPGRYAMNAYGQIVMEGQPFPPLPEGALSQSGGQGQWSGNSVYMPGRTSSGAAAGLHTGTASDGCTYIVTNGYSAESC